MNTLLSDMKLNLHKTGTILSIVLMVTLFGACGRSVTNVYDYYIKNNIEQHEPGIVTSGRTKLLYRHEESVNKAQLELIAFKNDKMKCLVVGSHKVAKAFYIYDSIYYFDVNDLYSNVRGNDFIRQLGDLSIFFTYIPSDKCDAFLSNVDKLKSEYLKSAPSEGTSSNFDLSISGDVFVSMEKKFPAQLIENATTTLWVGKRKHTIKLDELIKAMQELKSFN